MGSSEKQGRGKYRILFCEKQQKDHKAMGRRIRCRAEVRFKAAFPDGRLLLHDPVSISAASLSVFFADRFRGLDDQAVFWHVIRRSTDPPVYPLGKCRHVQDGELLKVSVPPVGKDTTIVPMHVGGDAGPLVTCVLDSCTFSSGMISRLYLPEYTYGAYVLYYFAVGTIISFTDLSFSCRRSIQTFYSKTWHIGMKQFVHCMRIISRAITIKPSAWKNMVSG